MNKTYFLSIEYSQTHTKCLLWKSTHLQKKPPVDRKSVSHKALFVKLFYVNILSTENTTTITVNEFLP